MFPLLAAAALLAAAPTAEAPTAEDRLAQLKALTGDWRGTTSGGRPLTISYRVIAGDSVVVERWTAAGGRETMTVFHRDGPDLIATHYCAQGNQPRLRLATGGTAERLDFAFRDATNLATPDASHQHAFSIRLTGPDMMTRSETYRAGGKDETELVTLRRGSP